MRTIVAGLIGGIVLFLWGAIAHVVLPIGEMGMKVASNQDAAMTALRPRYGNWVIFEHCMPFDVSRAFDEAEERPSVLFPAAEAV